jgi:hypothetical protein
MEDSKKPPIVFANRVIRKIVDNSFGEKLRIEGDDFMTIRTTYRSKGGNWEQFWHGDPIQQNLLKQVIVAWGQMPDRIFEKD